VILLASFVVKLRDLIEKPSDMNKQFFIFLLQNGGKND
jgi:hypothetical protein